MFENFVLEVAKYFGISKQDVLDKFYVRDIPMLTHKLAQSKVNERLKELGNYQMLLNIQAATAGMCPSAETVQKISNTLSQEIEKYQGSKVLPKPVRDQDRINELKKMFKKGGK